MSLEIEAMEERITKAVELVKGLREEKNRLGIEVERLKGELGLYEEDNTRLRQERDVIRERLENVLSGIEGLVG